MAKLTQILLPDAEGVYDGTVVIDRSGNSLRLTDSGGVVLLSSLSGKIIPVQFFGDVTVTSASNYKIWQKKVYFPSGATITGAHVAGCGGVDPSKLAGNLTTIHVSNTDYAQAGTPAGFDVSLPGNAGTVRVGSQSLSIETGGYAYVFITSAAGGHMSPTLVLEY